MATRTISDTGGNWSDTAAWVEGIVPTFADDVVATATSGPLTVDVASNCRSINLTGYISTLNTPTQLSIAGEDGLTVDVVFPSTMTHAGIGNLSIGYTASGYRTFNLSLEPWWNSIRIGDGINPNVTVNLQSDLIGITNVTVTSGTFRTNNHSLDLTAFNAYNSNAKTLDFGSSAITLRYAGGNNALLLLPGGTTVVANTAVVTFAADGAANVDGTDMKGMSLVWNSNAYILNGGTYKDVTVTGAAPKTRFLLFSGTTTITGKLTIKGNSSINRILVKSYLLGTARRITAASVDMANVDFQDITGGGTADWDLSNISGGSGDCGGNDGITFTPSQTNYWRGGTGNWSDSTKWGNLAPNPSFESWGETLPTSWASDRVACVSKESTYKRSGTHAVKLTTTVTNGTGDDIYINLGACAGKRLTVSFWTRGDGTNAGRYLWLYRNASGIQYPMPTTSTGVTGAEYQQVTLTFDVPGDSQLCIIILVAPISPIGAYAYFDDVCVSEGDTAVYGRVPLPQDDAVFPEDAFTGTSKTLTLDMPRLGTNIDLSAVPLQVSVVGGSTCSIYGNLDMGRYGFNSVSGGFFPSFEGRNGVFAVSTGVSQIYDFIVNSIGGEVILQSAIVVFRTLKVLNGTFSANDFNVTVTGTTSSALNQSAGTTINMGNGTWYMGGHGISPTSYYANWDNSAGGTINAGLSTIILASTRENGKRFEGGGQAYNNLIIVGGGTGAWQFAGANTFNKFVIGAPKTVQFVHLTPHAFKAFVAQGTPENVITITSTMHGNPVTLLQLVGVVSCNHLSLKDTFVSGGAMWFAGKQSTDAGGNGGWIFETYTPPTMLD